MKVKYFFETNSRKWRFHRFKENYENVSSPKHNYYAKSIPGEFVTYSNLLQKMCHRCAEKKMTVDHLKFYHGIIVEEPSKLIQDCHDTMKIKKLKRNERLQINMNKITPYLNAVKNFIVS